MSLVLVVGAGAIGGTLAGYLARAGRDVVVTDTWARHIEAIRDGGLVIEAPGEQFTIELAALHIDELAALPAPVDVVVIATKAYDTEWAYRLAAPYLAPGGVVLSAQNGMVEELLPRFADMHTVVGCSVIFAAECLLPGRVIRRSAATWPVLAIGELDGTESQRVEALARLFEPIGRIEVSKAIVGKLWAKLVVNTMSNGTAAVTGATSGMVWGDAAYAPVTVALASETAKVAEAAGIPMELVFGRVFHAELVRAYDGDPRAASRVASQFAEVAAARAGERDNKPSMLQDILKGRRTEIEYLNGYVAARGAEYRIETPVNARLADLVREVDRGQRETGPGNLPELVAAVPAR